MKPFNEYLDEQKPLNESIIRSGSVVTLAAKSASNGKKAEKAYKRGLTALNKPVDRKDPVVQLEQFEVVRQNWTAC